MLRFIRWQTGIAFVLLDALEILNAKARHVARRIEEFQYARLAVPPPLTQAHVELYSARLDVLKRLAQA